MRAAHPEPKTIAEQKSVDTHSQEQSTAKSFPWKNSWEVLNKPFTLWVLSAVILGIVYKWMDEEHKKAETNRDNLALYGNELSMRLRGFQADLNDISTNMHMREERKANPTGLQMELTAKARKLNGRSGDAVYSEKLSKETLLELVDNYSHTLKALSQDKRMIGDELRTELNAMRELAEKDADITGIQVEGNKEQYSQYYREMGAKLVKLNEVMKKPGLADIMHRSF
jgi:hypothetical protein